MITAISSASVMEPVDLDWLPALLQCNDSAYPVGAFAHSFGLEGMVQAGVVVNANSLASFLEGPVRHGLSHVDLPLISHSWRAAKDWDVDSIITLDHLSAACRAPQELRNAASRVGRQRLELLRNVWRGERSFPDIKLPFEQAPVVAGIEGQILGFPRRMAMLSYAHNTFAGILNAAIKVLRLGQTAVQRQLMTQARAIPELIDQADQIPLDDLGSFAPLLDVAAMRHERSPARLFLS